MRAFLFAMLLLPWNAPTHDINPWGHPHHHGMRVVP